MIEVKELYKVFGANPTRGVEMAKQGMTRAEILKKTGLTLGVNDASFEIHDGEIFVIMGLSGSGKSTAVRMLNRLIEPTDGSVIVDGEDVTAMNPEELVRFRRAKMSMVFQSFALMPHLTVTENAAFGLELAGVDESTRTKRAHEALEQVGLKGWEKSYPAQLSGGMQQRVGLARALAVDPSILLMDEAFSALDPLIRTEMQDELLKLQSENERTIVFISHDLDEALRIGDRIAIMEGGNVVQVGTPEDILQNPANEYVQAFFRGVDPTTVLSAGDIARKRSPTIVITRGGNLVAARELVNRSEHDYGYVLDSKHRFLGVVSNDSLAASIQKAGPKAPLSAAFLAGAEAVAADASMQDILPKVADRAWPVPVVNEAGVYQGVVSKNQFLTTLHRSESMDLHSSEIGA